MDALCEQLKMEIRAGKVLAVVGAGISVGATSNNIVASWTGLLKHGAAFCEQLSLKLPPNWQQRVIDQIDSGDITEMTLAAQNIAERLQAPHGGDFRRWLRESVGSLVVLDDSTIQAIIDLNLPIATTNYDSLLTSVSSLPPVVWTTVSAAQRWYRNDQQGVLHLHGHWESPESVVLGVRTYDEILRSEATQSLLKDLLYSRTLLFIGFGSGLTDPNFAALLKWSQRVLAESEYNHFRLVLNSKVDEARANHQGDRIRVIGIGDSYDQLPSFLLSLGATPKLALLGAKSRETQVQKLTEGRGDLFRRKALLDEEKASISADEYISRLATIAEALAKIGGTKSAVRMLHTPLSRTYTDLSFAVRTEKGIVLVGLHLDDGDFKFAMDMLRTLFEDCISSEAPPEVTEKFWSLSASCCGSQFDYDNAVSSFTEAIKNCRDEERRLGIEADRHEFQFLRGFMLTVSSDQETA